MWFQNILFVKELNDQDLMKKQSQWTRGRLIQKMWITEKTPVKPYSLQEAGPTSCIIRIIRKEDLFFQEKWHLGTVQGVILYKVLAFFLLSPSNQYPVVFHRILFKHANLISNLHQMCTSCSCVHMGVTSLVTVIAAVSLRRLLPSYCLILFLFWVTSFFVVKI